MLLQHSKKDTTPLIAAAKHGHLEAVRLLLLRGALDYRATVRLRPCYFFRPNRCIFVDNFASAPTVRPAARGLASEQAPPFPSASNARAHCRMATRPCTRPQNGVMLAL